MERASLDPAVAELLVDYPVLVTTQVAWGDMDANHHVNNTVYFRYMEHARLQYFGQMGYRRQQRQSSVGPILAWTDCRFRIPLEYPDTVTIGTRISEIMEDRFIMDTIVVSHKHKAIAANGQQRLVIFDYAAKVKAKLDDDIRRGIEEIEAKAKSK